MKEYDPIYNTVEGDQLLLLNMLYMQQTKNVYSKEVLCLCNRISICLFLYFYAVYNIFLLLTKFQMRK
jgi:uncharacterized membrane protein YesL